MSLSFLFCFFCLPHLSSCVNSVLHDVVTDEAVQGNSQLHLCCSLFALALIAILSVYVICLIRLCLIGAS